MTVSNGDRLRATAGFTLAGGSRAFNVFHFNFAGGNATADVVVLADLLGWANTLADTWRLVAAATAIWDSIQVSKLVAGEWQDLGTELVGVAGTGSGEQASHGVAGVSRVTLTGGKGQGRKFWAGVSEAQVSSGLFNAGATGVFTVLSILYSAVVDAGGFPGTQEIYEPGTLSNQVIDNFRPFVGASIFSTIPGYQRKRKPGVGV